MTCQFREDTGEPSIYVREFNLIACLLVQSSRKTPFQTWMISESSQPVSPAGTVAYLIVVLPTEPPGQADVMEFKLFHRGQPNMH